MITEIVCLQGHILDSLTLSKVLDKILENGGAYQIMRLIIGESNGDLSLAEISISAQDTETLEKILSMIFPHGAETK